MYHCHIHFYLIGACCKAFNVIKEMSPLENFTHEFWEGSKFEEGLLAKADVILVDLSDLDGEAAIQTAVAGKSGDAECILLASQEQIVGLAKDLSQIKDVWTMPMSDEEIKFRFLRWQQTYKMSKDFWQTNHFWEATINNIPNLIWYKDKNGVHEIVNDSFCKTVNKTKEQVEGRKHAYIWDAEYDDPVCIESEQEVMRKQQTCISEEEVKNGEGIKLLTTYKSPLYNLDGSVMGTVGVAIDITKERAYEQEIIEKNRTLETIFSTMDCGMLCHTIDGSRIISINKAALKILGYESQEEMTRPGFDMVAPSVMDEDKEKLRASIKKLKEEGDSVSVEYRVQHPDGEILYVMGNVKLLRENGELYYQRFLLDCTTQKVQEKKERMKREKRQMELIQALGIDYNIVCFFDLETGMGNTLRMENYRNHVIESVFSGDILLEESIGRYIESCVHLDDQQMMREAFTQDRLRQELTEKRIYHINYRVVHDGEIKYFQMKAVYVGKWDGNQGVVIGIRSVDEEIRDEMEKKRMLEEALLQAQKANKAKSTFLSNMSHDIRTPMNAIVGFTNLASEHLDCKEQVKEYLEKINASGKHLLHLINDILDMSRIESGKIQLEDKPCSLLDILYGLYNIVQVDIRAKQLELYFDTENISNEYIYCDQLRLNQVLLNLLSNAVKYTEAGGSISLTITEKPGAPVGYANYEICIKDTGIGMSKEFVSHIFEPFERERNSTISKIQGTGLGMAITKNIVEMMNGTIEVESEQNKGTEIRVSFTFRLRCKGKKSLIIPELENKRALVVSENSKTCDNISSMLRQIGMRPEQVSSGEEAVLRTCQASKEGDCYHTYIIEQQLDDRNSIEVIRKIKKELGERESVIVMAAYDWSDIRNEAQEAGVDAFCGALPILPELRNCLKSVIHKEDMKEKGKTKSEKLYKGRILLVEDIEINQEIAVAILTEAGFSVEVAENGQVALDMLKEAQSGYYQLVLMDIQMPVMNGYEATKAIRSLENSEVSSIPIFAMSANAFEEDRQEALKCGMNGHIAKPIDVKVLLNTLRDVCD
ncbi:MAG: response regulator [Lachnospiraceae bacterium]|nr:response regulator [Lachnospiraceae bacterium]